MRTIARIAITFTGSVILVSEIATPKASANRGLADARDFWVVTAQAEAARFPRPQGGPGPDWPFHATDAVILASTRLLPTPDVADFERAADRMGRERGGLQGFSGENSWSASIRQQKRLSGTMGSSLRDSGAG